MTTASRLATSSLLVLLTATLATAAYARGDGHGGSNESTHVQVHSDARAAAGSGHQTVPNGAVPHHGYCPTCVWHKVVHIPTAPQGAAK